MHKRCELVKRSHPKACIDNAWSKDDLLLYLAAKAYRSRHWISDMQNPAVYLSKIRNRCKNPSSKTNCRPIFNKLVHP